MIDSCAILGQSPTHFYCGWNEETQTSNSIKQIIKDNILSLINDGVTEFYVVGDPGIGLWSSEIIIDLLAINPNLKLNIIEPYRNHCFKWPKMLQNRYKKLYCKCYEVFRCSGFKTKTAYLKAYFAIIDESDIVLVVYDPESECDDIVDSAICFAEHIASPMIIINPETLKIEKIEPVG